MLIALRFSNVSICTVLGFVDCSLTSSSATLLLGDLVRLEYVQTLDLSNNKIGENAEKFSKWWKKYIAGVATKKKLVLSDNDFNEDSKDKLISDFGKHSPGCQVVF